MAIKKIFVVGLCFIFEANINDNNDEWKSNCCHRLTVPKPVMFSERLGDRKLCL